jgi:hypothetical protein
MKYYQKRHDGLIQKFKNIDEMMRSHDRNIVIFEFSNENKYYKEDEEGNTYIFVRSLPNEYEESEGAILIWRWKKI